MKRRLFLFLLAVMLVVGSVAYLPGKGLPRAAAENRCGTIWAGKFYNYSSQSIIVKGDTLNNGVINAVVYPGQSAMERGVCDADHVLVPSGADELYVVYGSATITFYTGQWAKIGSNTFTCYDTGGDNILCYT